MDKARLRLWKTFFQEMDAWRKRESTLALFQQVEGDGTGKEWMHDVVAPHQKQMAKTMHLWGGDVSWARCRTEMHEMAARFRPLPVAVTRFDQRLGIAIGEQLPVMPVTDVHGAPALLQTALAHLLRDSARPRALLVAGSLT